ncbi:ABC transporter permease [Roseivirga sp.]|uniref:ABC transporter permease n=1 Tax=Roseivirga sp. TaxID=1964215 RepID=UPI003B8CE718
MLSNMFTIAWRNAIRHKQFSLLNILGLSIGITASLLIGLYVMNQMSYDNFHEKGDRIYRINQPMIWGNWEDQFASTGPNVAVALRADVPEFEEVTRLQAPGRHVVSYQPDGDSPKSFGENSLFIAEGNFFNVFTFPLIEGDPNTALVEPFSIVITEEMALKYFGKEEALGKTLKVDQGGNSNAFRVSGIAQSLPTNSHIQFDMLTSMSSYQNIKQREQQWIWTTFVTYGLVKPNTDIARLEAKIQAIPPKWAEGETQRVFGQTFEDYVQGKKWTLYLQPVKDAYIHSPSSGNRLGPFGNYVYVQIFSAVGLLILLLSSINFMNLSTARSANRAKEVGIRKTLGSPKNILIRQFIFESILFVMVSTVIALVTTEISINAFNTLANTELSLYQKLSEPVFLTSLVSFVFILGLAAGSYPAFYLSSFNPIEVLKGKLSAGFKGKKVRNGLVIFQFTISIALIISTMFVQKQLDFASNANLGFDNDNVIQIHNMALLNDNNKETFQTLLKSNAAFEEVGLSDLIPPNIWNEDKYKAYGPDNDIITLNRLRADQGYLSLLDLEFLEGRVFDETRGTDKYKIILNESAVKELGWGVAEDYSVNSIVGKHVTYPNSQDALFEVIGVVKDFNFNSVKYQISPLMIIHEDNDQMFESGTDFISIRVNSDVVQNTSDLTNLLNDVESKLSEVNSGIPFEYSLMDQDFEGYFRSEQQMSQVLNVFTVMALSIACLGLFGLAAFSAEQRKKELGVRKVLGASVYKLMYLFTAEFTVLIIVSLLIASPLAYLFVDSWLGNFAYKTPISPVVFIAAALGSIVVAWLTIGFQSLRAASRNPVEVLRDE